MRRRDGDRRRPTRIMVVGRTHTIVSLETRIRRKDGTENFGGFVCVGWISTTRFLCCGFLCARVISVSFSGSLFRLPRRGLPRPTALFSGYHAEGYHAHTDAFKLTGYQSAGLPHPSYHAPNKLLGTVGLSHLRVVFSYLSFHRLIRQ